MFFAKSLKTGQFLKNLSMFFIIYIVPKVVQPISINVFSHHRIETRWQTKKTLKAKKMTTPGTTLQQGSPLPQIQAT